MEAALCIGTDGSVNPESLIRFSLLSALSTQNDPPEARREAVLQEPRRLRHGRGRRRPRARETPKRRGRAAPGSSATCSAAARRATASTAPGRAPTAPRSSRRSAPRSTMPGCRPSGSTTSTPTAPATPENDKMEAMGCMAVFGERMGTRADLLQQVDDRPHAHGRRRHRGRGLAPDDRARPPPADHQLRGARPRHPARRGAERARDASVARVLSNSFGFGGQNTCLVLAAEPA